MRTAEQDGWGNGELVEVDNATARGRYVLLCDHASNALPPRFGTLGLSSSDLVRHIAFDPGALAVARELARRIEAPLVASRVSRLVIDTNRALDAPDLIPNSSEATVIPGNRDLPAGERAARIARIYEPFHAAIAGLLDQRARRGLATALVSIHSFTPVYHGIERPWQIGVLYQHARALAGHLLDALAAEPGLCVGENQPYSPSDGVYWTLSRHGEARGLEAAMIEIRNDLIGEPAGQAEWAGRLAAILENASWEAAGCLD